MDKPLYWYIPLKNIVSMICYVFVLCKYSRRKNTVKVKVKSTVYIKSDMIWWFLPQIESRLEKSPFLSKQLMLSDLLYNCYLSLFPICTNICTVVTSCICSITMHNICYNIFPAHSVNKLFYFVSNEPCWLGCTCLAFYLWHSSL